MEKAAQQLMKASPGAYHEWQYIFKRDFGVELSGGQIEAIAGGKLSTRWAKAAKKAKAVGKVAQGVGTAAGIIAAQHDADELVHTSTERGTIAGEVENLNMLMDRYRAQGLLNSPCARAVFAELQAAVIYLAKLDDDNVIARYDSYITSLTTVGGLIPGGGVASWAVSEEWELAKGVNGSLNSLDRDKLRQDYLLAHEQRVGTCRGKEIVALPFKESVIMDPSGWAYAGVSDNRVSGVIATIYQILDGVAHLWDAAQYNQQSPQVTGEGGLFAWDVPEGTWKVKLEKEGYMEAWSNEMDVPPARINVAINLLARDSKVDSVALAGDYIVVRFKHYMKMSATPTVTIDGKAVAGTWADAAEGVNEAGGREPMGRTLRVPVPAGSKGKTLAVSMSGGESYAGRALEAYSASVSVPADPPAPAPSGASRVMHRLYNHWSGEHFYTASDSEKNGLVALGWTYEGVGWNAPVNGADVHRLYNRWTGDHHFTTSAAERDQCVAAGWTYEGVGWKSGGSKPVYREYNPYAPAFYHNYTASAAEHAGLIAVGWHDEGTGWYGV